MLQRGRAREYKDEGGKMKAEFPFSAFSFHPFG
jgi:hypothetical protein